MRIALSAYRAAELRRQLGQVLPPSEGLEWRAELLDLLDAHHGETGQDEDARDVLRRLSAFWREQHSGRGGTDLSRTAS